MLKNDNSVICIFVGIILALLDILFKANIGAQSFSIIADLWRREYSNDYIIKF